MFCFTRVTMSTPGSSIFVKTMADSPKAGRFKKTDLVKPIRLRLSLKSADGKCTHSEELKVFLSQHFILLGLLILLLKKQTNLLYTNYWNMDSSTAMLRKSIHGSVAKTGSQRRILVTLNYCICGHCSHGIKTLPHSVFCFQGCFFFLTLWLTKFHELCDSQI